MKIFKFSEEIGVRFTGREDILCAKLKLKYGTAPDLTIAVNEPEIELPTSAHVPYQSDYVIRVPPPATLTPLDFRSSAFDPLLALQAKGIHKFINISALDNLSKCRNLLPKCHSAHASKADVQNKVDKKKSSAAAPILKTKMKHPKKKTGPIHEIVNSFPSRGPLSMLKKCLDEKRRVVVLLRRVNGLRGKIVGWLKAVDKHLNIVLMDVKETFIPMEMEASMTRDRKKNGPSKTNSFSVLFPTKTDHELFLQERHMEQVLIRGDNIVLIYPLPKGRMAAARKL